MAKTPVRPAFLVAAFVVAAIAAWVLVFVLSKRDFWFELNLFFAVVAAVWFLVLWAFLFSGWGLRGPDHTAQGWRPQLQNTLDAGEFLTHLPKIDLDLGGDDLVGVIVALVASVLAAIAIVALFVLLWGVLELVLFLIVGLLFFLVNRGFRAQVVRHRRAKGRFFRSLGLSLYLTTVSVGTVPLVLAGYRWWFL